MKTKNTNETRNIYIFTDKVFGRFNEALWGWVMTAEDVEGYTKQNRFGELKIIKSETGIQTFSLCEGGSTYRDEIPKFYAAYDALAWMFRDAKEEKISLMVSSELLSLAKSNPEHFRQRIEESKSVELKVTASTILNLLSLLDVEITNTAPKSRKAKKASA